MDHHSKGGKARAEALTKEDRSAISKNAAKARWNVTNSLPVATHGSVDMPLKIGGIELPCYVLEDGRRVLTLSGFQSGLGMAQGGSMVSGMNRLQLFISRKSIKPFVSKELSDRIQNPILFRISNGRGYGYEAEILAELCESVLSARAAKALQPQQQNIAQQCETLIRGFARVGIVALVDEATGYQKDRASKALSEILEAFIAKELQPWVKTFPDEFYDNLFRLRGLSYPNDSVKRPSYFGHLTNDIIYRRLAPAILEELKKTSPRSPKGNLKSAYHQRLTSDHGHPKLKEHLSSVIAIMKLSRDYKDFKRNLDIVHPKFNQSLSLDFSGSNDTDSGL